MPTLLSIDIGIKNLGWALIEYDSDFAEDDMCIDFGIYVIDDKKSSKESVVSRRCKRINEFFEMIKDKCDTASIDKIVIERQVNNNTQAMSIMYALVMKAFSIFPQEHIFIFDPKLKFTFYHEEYDTKNKAHKRKSIQKVRSLFEKYYQELLSTFDSFQKKDDISDAINQGITLLHMKGLLHQVDAL